MHFPLTNDLQHVLIAGPWREGHSSRVIDVLDPSTNAVLFRLHPASVDDVNDAVAAAWAAFREGPWGRMAGREKGRLLDRLAALLRDRVEVLAELETP